MPRPTAALVVAGALVAAGTTWAAPAEAARAAGCPAGTGVLLVVDFGELGGGVEQECAADGGGVPVADLLVAAGYELTYVMRQPGFVCRVDGVPADDPCVVTPPSDAYWGLWWADGESSRWTYASLGAASLTVPDGAAAALTWHSDRDRVPPRVPAPGAAGQTSVTSSATPVEGTGGSRDATGADGADGVPGWVAPVGIAALFAAAGGTAVLRRRGGGR